MSSGAAFRDKAPKVRKCNLIYGHGEMRSCCLALSALYNLTTDSISCAGAIRCHDKLT
jgi:hypothetical protein